MNCVHFKKDCSFLHYTSRLAHAPPPFLYRNSLFTADDTRNLPEGGGAGFFCISGIFICSGAMLVKWEE